MCYRTGKAQALVAVICPALCLLLGWTSAQAASDAVAHYNNSLPQAPDLSDGYVDIDGTKLHYVTAGEGPLVILHHGFPSFWYVWKHQIAALSRHYKVVAFDGFGSNLSDRPSDAAEYKLARLVEVLHQAAFQLGGNQPFALIGHDWGGGLAWAYAKRYPQRLQKLVVLSSPPPNLMLELLQHNEEQRKSSTYMKILKNPVGEYILSLCDAYPIWKMGYGKLVKEGYLSIEEGDLFRQALARPGALTGGINWYRANIPAPDAITEDNYWPPIGTKITTPSLLIWGQQDRAFVSSFLEQMPDYAADLRIEVIADAGHKPNLTHPEIVNRQILDFLGSLNR